MEEYSCSIICLQVAANAANLLLPPARRLGSHASRASAAALAAWVTTWQPHEPVWTISGRCRLICVAQRLLPRLDRRGSAPIRPPAKSRQIAKWRAKLRRNLRMVGYSAQISSAFSAIWLNGITIANGGATPVEVLAMAELRPSGAAPGPRAQDIDRYVGAKMRERRMMLGLSQQQLADLIGVTYQQAHKYEKGINRIAAESAEQHRSRAGRRGGLLLRECGRSTDVGHAQSAAATPARAGAQLCRPAEPQAPRGHLQSRPILGQSRLERRVGTSNRGSGGGPRRGMSGSTCEQSGCALAQRLMPLGWRKVASLGPVASSAPPQRGDPQHRLRHATLAGRPAGVPAAAPDRYQAAWPDPPTGWRRSARAEFDASASARADESTICKPHRSSSSSALAACKSGVSKPSVNQV